MFRCGRGAGLRGVEMSVQAALDTLSHDMAALVMGAVPDGSIAEEKLADECVTAEKLHHSARALFAPAYTASTEDLTAGVSPLATGELYFVYE